MPSDRAILWALRAAWATLPLTAGPAASAAIVDWSSAPRVVAAVLLWAAWTAGLVGTVVPRTQTVTALRAVSPVFAVLAIVVAVTGGASSGDAVLAIAATAAAAIGVAAPPSGVAAVNAAAYGDERRFPLRVPPALFAGPLPLARAPRSPAASRADHCCSPTGGGSSASPSPSWGFRPRRSPPAPCTA